MNFTSVVTLFKDDDLKFIWQVGSQFGYQGRVFVLRECHRFTTDREIKLHRDSLQSEWNPPE